MPLKRLIFVLSILLSLTAMNVFGNGGGCSDEGEKKDPKGHFCFHPTPANP